MAWPAFLAAVDRAVQAHLGGTVRYKPRVGPPVDVRGVFDAVYRRADVGDVAVGSSGPAVFLRLADLPTNPEKDEAVITVDGVSYTVREAQPDGQGGILLHLHFRA